jgi:hypothetical protein
MWMNGNRYEIHPFLKYIYLLLSRALFFIVNYIKTCSRRMAIKKNDSTGPKLNTATLSKKSKGSAESKKREKKDF